MLRQLPPHAINSAWLPRSSTLATEAPGASHSPSLSGQTTLPCPFDAGAVFQEPGLAVSSRQGLAEARDQAGGLVGELQALQALLHIRMVGIEFQQQLGKCVCVLAADEGAEVFLAGRAMRP